MTTELASEAFSVTTSDCDRKYAVVRCTRRFSSITSNIESSFIGAYLSAHPPVIGNNLHRIEKGFNFSMR